MRIQIFEKIKKTACVLLAVMFVTALSVSVGAASCSSCDSCDSCCDCDSGCDTCCCEDETTWEDWFNVFLNDGFDTWSGVDFDSFADWFSL
jgi:hypothetical protein